MATTRNIKQIDEALRRPGRMDRVFHLQRPTQAERERILQIAAKENMDEELIDMVDWKKVISSRLSLSSICKHMRVFKLQYYYHTSYYLLPPKWPIAILIYESLLLDESFNLHCLLSLLFFSCLHVLACRISCCRY